MEARILYIQMGSLDIYSDYRRSVVKDRLSPGLSVEFLNLDYEPRTANLPRTPIYMASLLSTVVWAEQRGYDAAIIGCFADPGLREASRMCSMPVLGSMQLGMNVATLLGKRPAVLSPADRHGKRVGSLWWHEDNIHCHGYRKEMVSFRRVPLDRPSAAEVADLLRQGRIDDIRNGVLGTHKESIATVVADETRAAIAEDGADVIVLACALWGGMAGELSRIAGVPVVDPLLSCVEMAGAFVRSRK